MATSIVGAIGSFDPSSTQWTSYIEQMEEFFLANKIEENRTKVAVLISTVGSQTYELLKDLCSLLSQIQNLLKTWLLAYKIIYNQNQQ